MNIASGSPMCIHSGGSKNKDCLKIRVCAGCENFDLLFDPHDPAHELSHEWLVRGLAIAEQFAFTVAGDHASPVFRIQDKDASRSDDNMIEIAKRRRQIIYDSKL